MMPSMSTPPPDEPKRRGRAVYRACRDLVNHAPLMLPLAVVSGVIYGGTPGWAIVCVALAAAAALRAYRILLCAFFCGVIMVLCLALRQRAEDELGITAMPPPVAVELRGTVIRSLNRGCIVETDPLGVRVAAYGKLTVQPGDYVHIIGSLRNVEPPLVPGMFSQAEWMRGSGIAACLDCQRFEREGSTLGYATLLRAAAEVRSALADRLMPPGTEDDIRRQVLCALVLGEKDRADTSTIDVFRRGGCLHAFAVSGLHVGIVAGILWMLLRWCRVHPRAGRPALLIGVGLYVFATGMAVPALRAYVMLAVLMGSLILRRRPSYLNTWCFAAIVVLMLQPWQFYQPGFRLSFVVYGAICLGVRYGMSDTPWFGPDSYIPARIHTHWERLTASTELFVRGTVVVSMCAWLVSLPLSIAHFHVVNTASYLVNILIAPLLPVTMFIGLLVLVFAGVPYLGGLVQACALGSSGWLVSLVGFCGSLPGAFLPAAPPAPASDYMLMPLGHGKSACVLGNPGILAGDVHRKNDVRYVLQPALFHAGYSPALCPAPRQAAAKDIYTQTWPQLHFFTAPPGTPPQSYTTPAGVFTIFAPPASLPVSYSANASPIICWQRTDTQRFLFIGNAALSTYEALPPEFRHADVLILGYNSHEPIEHPNLLREIGAKRIILLPSAHGHNVERFLPQETAQP